MRKIFVLASICLVLLSCQEKKAGVKTDNTDSTGGTSVTNSTMKTPPVEFADPKYMEIGKRMLAQFESGNLSEWFNGYSDSAVYNWSSGDSLVGKQAIEKYWTERRGKVIDSIKFTNDIWLPIKINTPQKGPDQPGIWLLNWYQVDVKYKTGKKLTFWVHTDHHFDANDKVDRSIQYIDMAPIKEAIK